MLILFTFVDNVSPSYVFHQEAKNASNVSSGVLLFFLVLFLVFLEELLSVSPSVFLLFFGVLLLAGVEEGVDMSSLFVLGFVFFFFFFSTVLASVV